MRIVFLLLTFIFFGQQTYAQQDSLSIKTDDSKIEVQKITDDDLKSYKEDSDFNYIEEIEEESFIQKFQRWLQNILTKIWEAIFGVGTATGFLYFVFNILPYILLAFLVFLLVKFFLKVNSRNIVYGEQKNASFQFTEEEHIIKNEDINALISDAIKNQNYRLAIRYYYLQTLKFLTEKNIISWEPEKTNEDYIKEIDIDSLNTDFKSVTKIYDYVWYGEFSIDELKFEKLKTTFETVNNSIKN